MRWVCSALSYPPIPLGRPLYRDSRAGCQAVSCMIAAATCRVLGHEHAGLQAPFPSMTSRVPVRLRQWFAIAVFSGRFRGRGRLACGVRNPARSPHHTIIAVATIDVMYMPARTANDR